MQLQEFSVGALCNQQCGCQYTKIQKNIWVQHRILLQLVCGRSSCRYGQNKLRLAEPSCSSITVKCQIQVSSLVYMWSINLCCCLPVASVLPWVSELANFEVAQAYLVDNMLCFHQKLAEVQLRGFQAVVYMAPLLWGPVAASPMQSPAAGGARYPSVSWQTD